MTGAITFYTKLEVPTGFLLCNGQAVSRVSYASLFSVIGTSFGAGNGTTTFNIPDLGGRTPVGKDTSTSIGSYGGSATINISHTHTHTGHTHTTFSGSTSGLSGSDSIRSDYQLYASTLNHQHTITAGTAGSSSDNTISTVGSATQSILMLSLTFYPLIEI